MGASFTGSRLYVDGAGSILTVQSETRIAHLEVINGGKMTASNIVYIVNTYNPDDPDKKDMGSIKMDAASCIEINAGNGRPALVSTELKRRETRNSFCLKTP